jgi:hypothetical protein
MAAHQYCRALVTMLECLAAYQRVLEDAGIGIHWLNEAGR